MPYRQVMGLAGACAPPVTAPARREGVRQMVTRGLSERRALAALRMSASALRYVPAPDRNGDLRTRIIALAHRHRRYGAGIQRCSGRTENSRTSRHWEHGND